MSKKVLLVDDDELILEFFDNFLRRYGLTVFKASTGNGALEAYKKEQPDLVFLDISLPDINGIKVLEELKKIDKEAKVIMITGLQQQDLEEEAKRAGAQDFIHKPITFGSLKERITNLLG